MKQLRLYRFACFLAAFIFTASSSTAQYDTTAFYVKKYTAFDGLPDTYTLDIFQDSKQYLWIGTYSGLSRFDGAVFTNFGVRDGLKDSYVSRFIEFDNHIWIGNRSSIGYLDKNKFVQTFFEDSTERLFFVFAFQVLQSGKLCVFTSKGIHEWNGHLWVKSTMIPEMKNEHCQNVLEMNGRTYIFFFDKIIVLEKSGSKKIIPVEGDDKEFYQWARKFGEQIFVYTKKGLFEVKNYSLSPVFSKDLNKKSVTCFFRDSEKKFWVATREDGLLVSRPGDLNSFTFKVPAQTRLTLSIYEDRGHNIWVADYSGLLKIRNTFFTVHSFTSKEGGSSWYFPFLDTKKEVSIFHHKTGLIKFVGEKIQTGKFVNEKFFSASGRNIMGLKEVCYDDEGSAWVVLRNNKLIKVGPDGSQKEMNPPPTPDFAAVSVAWTHQFKKIFCGTGRLYTIEKDSFRLYIPPNTRKPLQGIISLFVLKNGNVLVNCRKTGLWVITKSGNAYNAGNKIPAEPDVRMNFAEDNNGKLWIAFTGTGLQRFRWVNDTTLVKEAEVTTLNRGLPNDIVETMAVDKKNRLWAATLSGVVVIDTLAKSGENNFVSYNLSKIEKLRTEVSIGLTHIIADADGDIWLCSNERIIHFRADLLDLNSLSPVTHIEDIKLNMKKTDWGKLSGKTDSYFMLPEGLSLPYNQNTLTFSFKGINYSSDEDIWYSYKLMGVDTSWGTATLSNVISFIKLTPGYFTFMVKSRNSNSSWSEPATFSFTIRKPFWQTWWFRTLGILAASLVLVYIFRTQLKRVSKRAALQHQLRNLEMKALKAQMNPHFIYNALNSIQSLVIDDKKSDALDYMVKFSRLLRQVLNHSELNAVPLSKEVDYLSLYIQLESLRLNYPLEYSIKVDENIIPENEMVPPLILQPFVENSLWHGLGSKQGEKKLEIKITGDDETLLVEIIDNGIGRAAAAMQKRPGSYQEGPHGMNITESRLLLYNEKVVEKAIVIQDLYDKSGTPVGTKVILRIRRR